MLVDEVAGELGESVTLAVTVKDRSEHDPVMPKRMRGSAAYSVQHADGHHAAHEQAK